MRRSLRLDPAWLLTRERDFPNDAPTWEEMSLWFAASVGCLIAAGLLTWPLRGNLAAMPGCLMLALLLAALGPNILSAWADRCLFTWPLALYAAFHGAVLACAWAEQRRAARWRARLSVVGLVLVGYGYYEACKLIGMFIAWSFLIGFPFAFPLTVQAARADLASRPRWQVAAWTLLAFTAFFWSAQGLLLWKASE